jgi:hypothetical protein
MYRQVSQYLGYLSIQRGTLIVKTEKLEDLVQDLEFKEISFVFEEIARVLSQTKRKLGVSLVG